MRGPILLFAIFLLMNQKSQAQELDANYFIGKWTAIDSLTGSKYRMHFKNYGTRIFSSKKGTFTSSYKYKYQDPTILMEDSIPNRSFILLGEEVIVAQSYNCYWSFNPNDYERYIKAKNNKNLSINAEVYSSWLRGARIVYYRKR